MRNIIILLFQFNLLIVFGQCPTSITLSIGNLNTLLTQSGSWINTTSSLTLTTTANITSIIKLDANPINGYVELNPGFVASPTTGAFIAQALDGCGMLTPSRPSLNNNLESFLNNEIKIYPNPSKDIFNIQIDNTNKVLIEVFNTLGMKIYDYKLIDANQTEINLSGKAAGTYIVKITTDKETVFNKIIKY